MSENQQPSATVDRLADHLVGVTEVHAPTPLSNAIRDAKLMPGVGTRHFLPRDEAIEGQLVEVEKLIRRRSYQAAVRAAQAVKLDQSDLASTYSLIVHEKIARAHLASGDRYLARGNHEKARASFRQAVQARSADARTVEAANMAGKIVGDLIASRSALIEQMRGMMAERQYENWCGVRHGLQNGSILDHLKNVVADVRLEQALGPRIPPNWPPRQSPHDGWVDPVDVDELGGQGGLAGVLLDRPALMPGSSFAALSARPVSLDAVEAFAHVGGVAQPAPATPLRASSSLPLIGTMLQAHARLYALDFNLSPIGLSRASMPVYRYSYLRERAASMLDMVAKLDARMLDMQFKLDDFAELIDTVRRHMDETSAEYQALNTRAAELQTTVAALSEGEGELGKTVQSLQKASDDCDVEWWEYVVSVLVVIAATAVGAGIGFLLGGPPGAVAGGVSSLVLSIELTIKVWHDRSISCDNVDQALGNFQSAHAALKSALDDYTAELHHTLLQRDAVIADLASLQYSYDEAMLANQARVLNATTLSHVLGVLDSVRNSTVMRAHAIAHMAQDAYNAETDSQINVVAASHSDYLDQDGRGYTAAAAMQRDLDGIEHIRVTSRTRKPLQLTQSVSLRKHYPSAFGAILLGGHGRFATRIAEFDRWYPGMYMQRLREVRVEVLVDGVSTPIRGYLSNGGTSLVRFPDHGNTTLVDGRDVLNEPDQALRQLCYKRRRRQHAIETMAFPAFASALYDARSTATQREERNVFEGCGLETTWHLELMPDQQLDYARISDVRIDFQYEALYDPALRQVVEAQRYTDRTETALLSLRELLRQQGKTADFSAPVEVEVSAFAFEAPHIDKPLLDVGIMVRHRAAPLLEGKATLDIDLDGAGAVTVTTNDKGIVATSPGQPAGENTAALQALIANRNAAGRWSVAITALPDGVVAQDIDDVLLMLRYRFKPA